MLCSIKVALSFPINKCHKKELGKRNLKRDIMIPLQCKGVNVRLVLIKLICLAIVRIFCDTRRILLHELHVQKYTSISFFLATLEKKSWCDTCRLGKYARNVI